MPPSLRILIPGGTGYLGTMLARHFHEQGHMVATITRFPKAQAWPAIHWDAGNLGPWADSFEDADAVINLTGRLRCTRLVQAAVDQCARPPRVWLNASGMGTPVEASTQAASTRTVTLRVASVMSPEPGGRFETLLRLVRWGFGGEMGDGEQVVSWIHDRDFVRAVELLMQSSDASGVFDVSAPQIPPNHQFMSDLRQAWSANHFGLPAPAWAVRGASLLLGSPADVWLKSWRLSPTRLLEQGFAFHFPEWSGASEDLVQRWRL